MDENLESDIRAFFQKEFGLDFDKTVNDSTNLFDGHIDSFGFIKIIVWVEKFSKRHGIKVFPEDLFADGFLSVQSMSSYLRSKLSAS